MVDPISGDPVEDLLKAIPASVAECRQVGCPDPLAMIGNIAALAVKSRADMAGFVLQADPLVSGLLAGVLSLGLIRLIELQDEARKKAERN